jgi:DNA-binding transcriptional regulator PaaX
MSSLDLIKRQENRMAIRNLLCERDCSINEISNDTGIAYGTVRAFVKRHLETGDIQCIQESKRQNYMLGFCSANGTISARYSWSGLSRNDQAEALIYRLLDRLIDVPLDTDGLNLVKEAQEFIGWNSQ